MIGWHAFLQLESPRLSPDDRAAGYRYFHAWDMPGAMGSFPMYLADILTSRELPKVGKQSISVNSKQAQLI